MALIELSEGDLGGCPSKVIAASDCFNLVGRMVSVADVNRS